jgi:hypothetical protein
VEVIEVRVGIAVQANPRWCRAAGEDVREPEPLGRGHVPHQAQQGQRGRWHSPADQFGALEGLAFPKKGASLTVEPHVQHGTFVVADRWFRPSHRRLHLPRLTGCRGEIIGRERAGIMANVRERWLSRRAVSLHVAVLVFVPGCAVAAWWQVNRAADGNQLSYLYSVLWPAFGLLGLYFWWMLIHTDYETVGLKGMQRQQAAGEETEADMTEVASPRPAVVPATPAQPLVSAEEDPELAAYNARLAELAAQGPKTWRARESVVVRREQ